MTRQPSSPNASCLNAKALILAQVDQSLDLSVDFSLSALSDSSFSEMSFVDSEDASPEGAAFVDDQQPAATSFLKADAAALGESSPAWLAAHVLACPDCRTYQTTMAHLTESLSDLEEVPLPSGLADRIMDRILADGGFSHGEGQDSQTLVPFPSLRDAAHGAADSASSSTSSEEVLTSSSKAGSVGAGFRWKKSVPIAAATLLLALGLPALYQTMTTYQPFQTENVPQRSQSAPLDGTSGTSREIAQRPVSQAKTAQQGVLKARRGADNLSSASSTVATKPAATSVPSTLASTPVSLAKALERGASSARSRHSASELRASGDTNTANTDAAFDIIDGQELAYDPMLDDPFLASAEWMVREEPTASISKSPQRIASSARTLAAARPSGATSASILLESDAELEDDPLSTMMGF